LILSSVTLSALFDPSLIADASSVLSSGEHMILSFPPFWINGDSAEFISIKIALEK
jgi:hypothetical protein